MPATFVCPWCGKPVPSEPPARPASFPFCASRCRDRDLGRWLESGYVVAGESVNQVPFDDRDCDRP